MLECYRDGKALGCRAVLGRLWGAGFCWGALWWEKEL